MKVGPWQCVIPENKVFKLPAQHNQDGPQGVAAYLGNPVGLDNAFYNVTNYPTQLSVSLSWDTDIAYDYGEAVGREQRIKGATISLGPGVNLARIPFNGRNFEYLGLFLY